MITALLPALFLFAPGMTVPRQDTVSAQAQLMEADRAFAAATAARGLEGWMDAYASDAARLALGGPAVRGLGAIREADAGLFADTQRRLIWEPTEAGIFEDGRHGFTTGTSAFVLLEGEAVADTLSTGRYITFWRREADGTWKIILDTGVTDPPQSD